MKQLYLVPVMCITAMTFVFSQSTDKEMVLQTLNQMATALRTNDNNALDKLYADDYTSVGTGGVINKAERLESIKSGQLKYESFDYKDVKIRIYGNTAVANATIKVKLKGKDIMKVLSTMTLVKNSGQWEIVAAQSTNIN